MVLYPSSTPGRWSLLSGAGITLLGLILLFTPIDGRKAAILAAGTTLVLTALLEMLSGFKSSRPPVRRIELAMSLVTLAAAAVVLLRPDAYPLYFVAILCLAARGVGAAVAAFYSVGVTRFWVLGRGGVDLLLTALLIAGAPVAALVSMLSGRNWPVEAAAVLSNFVAVSVLATGLSLIGIALTSKRARDYTAAEDA